MKIAGEIVAGAQRTDKPVFVTWGAREAVAPEAYALLDNARIPYYKSPVRCGRALAVLSSYAEARRHAENLDTTNRPSPLGRAVGGEG